MAAISSFIPQVWSAEFTSRLRDQLVWASRCNTVYQGAITASGDTVKIPTPGTAVTVRDYTTDTDIAAAELATGTTQDLDIDKQKYFHFYVDDIDEAQTSPSLMGDAMAEAAYQMALQVDSDVQTEVNTAFDATREVAAIGEANTDAQWGTNFLQAVSKLSREMSEANIPAGGRWMVIHPQTVEGLTNFFLANSSDGVFMPATAEQALRNGFSGRLMGFDLLATTRVPDAGAFGSGTPTGAWRLFAGQGTEANAFASQITENEAYRPERRFGQAVKGLMVYGVANLLPKRLWTIKHRKAA